MADKAWACVCIVATCTLLPYNCLLVAQAYFDRHAFPGKSFPFTSMLCYSGPLCVMQGLLTVFGDSIGINKRMAISHVGMAVICLGFGLIALISRIREVETLMYALCLLCVVTLSALSSVMQSSIIGLASTMGPSLSSAAMCGLGISGLLSFGLSLLLELLPGGATGEALQAAALFFFCFLYTLLSAWVHFFGITKRVPSTREAVRRLEEQRTRSGTLLESGGSDGSNPRLRPVLVAIFPQAFNVFLTFAVSLSIFPGVIDRWVPDGASVFHSEPDLLARLLTGTFQVFDLAGRYAAEFTVAKCSGPSGSEASPSGRSSWTCGANMAGTLWLIVVLRVLFVPAFMLGQRNPESCPLWGSDAGRFFLVALMAGSNGFTASCAMMFGPGLCPASRREVAGLAMSFVMVAGIFSGTLLAFLTQL